jgi:2,4-dienoyl-CoA reductase-like NADH-dependent reductase (Old Yellow Enzyme family)
MSRHPRLFTPIELGGITLPNRAVVAPMCQYSAQDGRMTDWHLMHLGTFACSGAGLFVVEATGVTPEGRITPRCTGLYDDATEAAMARALALYRSITKHPVGIQLAHAGRKGSTQPPFLGGKPLADATAWQTVAPSPIPFGEGWPAPEELSLAALSDLKDAFVKATERSKRLGFDAVELHSAHGYLLHQFLSPLANQRKDAYGKERMKFPLEVAAAVREASGRASAPATGSTAARARWTRWRTRRRSSGSASTTCACRAARWCRTRASRWRPATRWDSPTR